MNNILKYKNILLIFSTTLIVASLASILVFGFRLGIDFKSGSLWQLNIPNTTDNQLREFFENDLGVDELNISVDENGSYALTLQEISEEDRQEYFSALQSKFGDGVESLDFWTISPSISNELRTKAFWAIGLVLVVISLFIAFAFRKVSDPIKSWKYGLITLITLFHDAIIPAGVFAALGEFKGVTIDTNFVVAMLFVIGFSVHDTIVVFDRIRESLLKLKETNQKVDLHDVVNKSIKSTLARSVNTSLTLIVVLLSLYFLGPISTQLFILAILIGTIAGTYSSIFFASPLLVLSEKFLSNPQKS